MKKFNKFLNKLKAFELTTSKEADAARTDILFVDKQAVMKELSAIYDKYNYWLKLYINAKHTDFSNDIDLLRFRRLIECSFNCSRYSDIEITNEVFREIWTIAATNRDNILLNFKDLDGWNATPKDQLSPDWLKVRPAIYLMFTGSNPTPANNPLIFDNTTLAELYQQCNNVFFEDVKYPEFENWFRVEPIGQIQSVIKVGNMSKFCQSLKIIQEKRDKNLVPNFEKWMQTKHGVTSWKDISKTYSQRYKKSK